MSCLCLGSSGKRNAAYGERDFQEIISSEMSCGCAPLCFTQSCQTIIEFIIFTKSLSNPSQPNSDQNSFLKILTKPLAKSILHPCRIITKSFVNTDRILTESRPTRTLQNDYTIRTKSLPNPSQTNILTKSSPSNKPLQKPDKLLTNSSPNPTKSFPKSSY